LVVKLNELISCVVISWIRKFFLNNQSSLPLALPINRYNSCGSQLSLTSIDDKVLGIVLN
jgi:hypothetical protein